MREWKYKSLDLLVMPGIFHPGWFATSSMLLEAVENNDLEGRTFLELGCGSGTQACRAAQLGATSYASDITHAACVNAALNAERNGVELNVIASDIFQDFPAGLKFDLVFVNPPFMQHYPEREADFAFCAGEHYEYFVCLFQDLKKHLEKDGKLVMALSKSCNLGLILEIAESEGLHYNQVLSTKKWAETNFLFEFTP